MKQKKRVPSKGFVFVCVILLLILSACEKATQSNGVTIYNHVNLGIDENDYYTNVGFADHVFVGTVLEYLENHYEDGRATTTISIRVDQSIKGALVENIIVRRNIGYDSDGNLILNATDTTAETGLPEVNLQYIFIANTQTDGSLLLADIIGHIPYSEELFTKFQEYYENENTIERERMRSDYDIIDSES